MVTISEKLFKVAEQFRWKVSNKSVNLSIDDTDIILKGGSVIIGFLHRCLG